MRGGDECAAASWLDVERVGGNLEALLAPGDERVAGSRGLRLLRVDGDRLLGPGNLDGAAGRGGAAGDGWAVDGGGCIGQQGGERHRPAREVEGRERHRGALRSTADRADAHGARAGARRVV